MSVVAMLGGRDLPEEVIRQWAVEATALYGADSGANRLLELGFRPTVVGDMDSFVGPSEGLRLVEDPDQETSDLDKLLKVVAQDGHRRLTVLGLEGDRLDHLLAGLHSLAKSPLDLLVVLRRGVGFLLGEGLFDWGEDLGSRCSVIPIGAAVVSVSGVRWPLDQAVLGMSHSLSNVIDPGPLAVTIHSGSALLFVERDPMRVVQW